MFILYKWMLRLFGWNVWVIEQPEETRQKAAQFQQQFNELGCSAAFIELLLLILLAVVLYYFWWSNGSSKRFKYRYRVQWWILWLFASAIVTALLTPGILSVIFLDVPFNFKAALVAVSICNFLYSIILFFVSSIIITKACPQSTNASCTPF